ncbi:hypothetical protein FHT86_006958 [Rhizobium sp. BK313]|uniref:Pepco domain-containing protein n=1 Tax=Rhizobium sp. BK313 TaxID=2587081 RepID=UPI001061A644|nr:hypothetical protein [Rhizobium sp. BK313]MBB3458632.1 hypothetical protein [Rhizobium sp. BK313]
MKTETVVVFEQTTPAASIGRPTHARGDRDASRMVQAVELSTGALETALTSFIETVRAMLEKVDQGSGDYAMDTVEVAAQVGADGKVGFMGVGIAAQATSSMKIVFKRKA